ncbi:FAD-dependent monooxygenase [Thermomonospora cellulosilytica]|uniref:2-polyprenyl-6-methoxyphenol hydroxylase-like FAD-dependent oxidoreductase n=1 Tax=Thermomonospora cellulosilytica TaxID=1411118 RepID=A0A7W3N2K1_9ACTN|nr:FAD-dependent monooxygenase [Thermomonospora cellulosilytica]MBA9006277.1 2-polyprenyl-6-methoxyphenol hydroxylase-like FAD-dependent oxidoreductase [Thermomonospora cellulosilytica]
MRTAVVAGGGIGGLAAAAALAARGWTVRVLERAPEFTEVGAGISLWPNALRALDVLGVGDRVRERAVPEAEIGVRAASGRWLMRTDVSELIRRYGPLVMIHRADLLAVLREAAGGADLVPSTEVAEVRAVPDGVEAVHTGGVTRADLVVGADGIRSAVRRSLWPGARPPRYAGYTAWRLLTRPAEPVHVGGETWGRGDRFGMAPLADGRVYCYAAAGVPPGGHSPDGELAELRRRFGAWHDPIPALLESASPESVLRHDIEELPPLKTFVRGRAVLLGDAAHAMTPNMGQGACQALEDEVTLAALLDTRSTVEEALAAYDSIRRPRAQRIARQSRLAGAPAQWSLLPAVVLRDTLTRLVPGSLTLRAMAPVLSWTPPA